MKLGALLSFVLLVACSPRLADGQFSCPDGACPTGFGCGTDGLCHSRPPRPDAAGLDAPALDAGTDAPSVDASVRPDGPLGDFARCTTHGECAGGHCYRGFADAWPHGYCTQRCVSGGCPARPGLDYGCEHPNEVCRLWCDSTTPCPPGFGCAHLGDSDFGECVAPDVPISRVPPEACTSDDDCDYRSACAMLPSPPMRVCVRLCGPAFACPAEERCGPSSDRGDVCLPPPP